MSIGLSRKKSGDSWGAEQRITFFWNALNNPVNYYDTNSVQVDRAIKRCDTIACPKRGALSLGSTNGGFLEGQGIRDLLGSPKSTVPPHSHTHVGVPLGRQARQGGESRAGHHLLCVSLRSQMPGFSSIQHRCSDRLAALTD